MYTQIVKKDLEKTFVVSDFHFNHDKDFVWGNRGFSSCESHNQTLCQEWNRRVTDEDEVFHLGDLTFGDANGKVTKNLIESLNFKTLYLMGGNHMSGFKALYKEALVSFLGTNNPEFEVFPLKTKVGNKDVVFVPNLVEVKVEKNLFVLCHYPILSYNNQANGTYMICGHSHGNCELTSRYSGKGRRIDVGIESFGGPVPLKFVVNYLKERDLDCVDHH